MAFIRVLLFKNEDESWDWLARLDEHDSVSGSGFPTAQDAVTDAAQHERIKGRRFYAEANKRELFNEDGEPIEPTVEEAPAEPVAETPSTEEPVETVQS